MHEHEHAGVDDEEEHERTDFHEDVEIDVDTAVGLIRMVMLIKAQSRLLSSLLEWCSQHEDVKHLQFVYVISGRVRLRGVPEQHVVYIDVLIGPDTWNEVLNMAYHHETGDILRCFWCWNGPRRSLGHVSSR